MKIKVSQFRESLLIFTVFCVLLKVANTATTNNNTTSQNSTITNTNTSNNQTINSSKARNVFQGKVYYEQNLIQDIMENYDPRSLPFYPNPNSTLKTTFVPVKLQFEIYGINFIDISKGLASFKSSVREWWYDLSL